MDNSVFTTTMEYPRPCAMTITKIIRTCSPGKKTKGVESTKSLPLRQSDEPKIPTPTRVCVCVGGGGGRGVGMGLVVIV